jgi:hypothetical protein
MPTKKMTTYLRPFVFIFAAALLLDLDRKREKKPLVSN